jgi:hypothetical protein
MALSHKRNGEWAQFCTILTSAVQDIITYLMPWGIDMVNAEVMKQKWRGFGTGEKPLKTSWACTTLKEVGSVLILVSNAPTTRLKLRERHLDCNMFCKRFRGRTYGRLYSLFRPTSGYVIRAGFPWSPYICTEIGPNEVGTICSWKNHKTYEINCQKSYIIHGWKCTFRVNLIQAYRKSCF